MKPIAAVLAVLLLAGPMEVRAAEDGPPRPVGREVIVHVEPQAWQVRRSQFFQTVKAFQDSQGKDVTAVTELRRVLLQQQKKLVSLTPMEAMDIFGVYYIPLQGPTSDNLMMVALYATLGWYDALRFADASGRAEIENNERFFLRAFGLSGQDSLKRCAGFLADHPEEAAKAVGLGTTAARLYRNRVEYDEHWPTAYGLTRMRCGLQGKKDCPPPPALPREKWDQAFADAVALVERYYKAADPKKVPAP